MPMSEQTPTTAGHGLELLGPVVIEGSPEALQTDAMQAPSLSQIDSDTAAETDEQTETLNVTMVPTPAMHLAADTTHPASSVYGAGAVGTGPPPSGLQAAPPSITSMDPCSTDPTYRDLYYRDPTTAGSSSSDLSLAPNVLVRSTAIPRSYSFTHTTYGHEQSQSALSSMRQPDSERSSKDTLHSQEIGDDFGPEMKASGVSKFFQSLAFSKPTTALGARPKQAAASI